MKGSIVLANLNVKVYILSNLVYNGLHLFSIKIRSNLNQMKMTRLLGCYIYPTKADLIKSQYTS